MKTKALRLLPLILLLGLGQVMARPVDLQNARAVGARFMNANTRTPLRGAEDLQLVTTYSITRGDAAFYVFNTPNGFVIVAADDCATPILGYSDEGRPFDLDNVPIQLQDYLQGFVEQIQYGIENRIEDESIARQWELVRRTGKLNENRDGEAVEPLITANWGQGCYYNAMCPENQNGPCGHCVTGCVATAMGMIMHYWGYPMHGNGSSIVNIGETTYDWANMPNQLTETSTQEEIDAVSLLLWHCGVSVGTNYGASSSGADYNSVEFGLSYNFCYDINAQHRWDNFDDWLIHIKANLMQSEPIYYSGNDDNGAGGHAWVCDGFDYNDLLHFNWGWNGLDNGYFTLGALNVGYEFNNWHYAVFDIHPPCDQSMTYNITANTDTPALGTVSGGGVYSCEQVCNLLATANEGYAFSNWTENGRVVSTTTNYSFLVCKNRALVAHFEPATSYVVSATVDSEEGGLVFGAGNFDYGTNCSLTATANDGYLFQYWTENGRIVSEEPDYSFIVTEDRHLVAHFSNQESTCNIIFELYSFYGIGWEGVALEVFYGDGTSEQFTLGNGSSIGSFVRNVEDGSHITAVYYPSGASGSQSVTIRYANGVTIWELFNCCCITSFEFDVDCEGAYLPRTITTTAEPSEGGSVVGAGTYVAGSTCVLAATPNPGYSFANWTENGEIVSSEAMYIFNVEENRDLIANFTLPLSIDVTVNIAEGGIVTGSGTFVYGQECTLQVEVNQGYSFYYWIENNEIVSTSTTYSFEVISNRELIAVFGEPLCITAVSNIENGGVIIGDGIYNYTQLCVLNATPNNGYRFKWWMENDIVISCNSNIFFNVTGSRNLVAVFDDNIDTIPGLLKGMFSISAERQVGFSKGNLQYIGSSPEPYWRFAENQYDYLGDNGQCDTLKNVDRDLFGWGTSGINHGAVCYQPWSTSQESSNYFAYGQSYFNLDDQTGMADWGYNAINNGGNELGQWRSLTMDEWIYLIDTRNTLSGMRYAKAIVNNINGVVLLPDNWDASSYCLANANSDLAHYDENVISLSSWEEVLEPAGAVFLPAAGERLGTEGLYFGWYCLYWSSSTMGWAGAGVIFSDAYLYSNAIVELFVGNAVRLIRDHRIYYTISANPDLPERGVVSGDGIYEEGSVCSLTASPNHGFLFVNWTENGEEVSSEATYSFTVSGDRNLTANFVPIEYHWNVDTNQYSNDMLVVGFIVMAGEEQFTDALELGAFCDGECRGRERPMLSPTTDHHLLFITLYGDNGDEITFRLFDHQTGEEVDMVCTSHMFFEVNGSWGTPFDPYVFNFEPQYNIVALANPTEGGITVGSDTYFRTETCSLIATANEGYIFVNWTEDDQPVSDLATFEFTVTGDRTLVANFSLKNYEILATTNPTDGGTITGASIYDHFSTCTLTATANEGFSFVNWTEDGVSVSESTTFEFTVTGARTLVANFSLNNYEVSVTANPTEGGTVTGSGTYVFGTMIEVTASSNEGYFFKYWTEEGGVVSTNANYSFTVVSNCDLVAHFGEEDIISFADDNVKNICVERWDTNGDGELSYYEAATVTSLDNVFGRNSRISSFDELQYFVHLNTINDDEFSYCSSLSSIILPETVTSIGGYAFEGCSSLDFIEIPSSVTSIGYNAFRFCPRLWEIVVNPDNAVFDSRDNCNAIIETSTNTLVFGCVGTVIPNTVTAIGESAFNGCNQLSSIEIPSSVEYIGVYSFVYCGNIASIIIHRETPPALGWGAFEGVNQDIPVYVPCGSEEAYDAVSWGGFSDFREMCEGVMTIATNTIAEGWNWWTPTVNMETLLSQVETSLGSDGIRINSQGSGSALQVEGTWSGDLQNLVPGQMYRIQTGAPCTLTLLGLPITTATITINQGENWFGYIGLEKTIAEAFVNLPPAIGDKVISQDEGFAVFNGTSWEGTLSTLQPGHGYVYVSTANGTKTITFE